MGHNNYKPYKAIFLVHSGVIHSLDPPVIAIPEEPNVSDNGIEVSIESNNTCINNTFMGMVNFTCVVVTGRLPVNIRWLVDGEEFMNDSHSMSVLINSTTSKLIIGVDSSASVEQDLKNYTCIATNSDGSDTAVSVLSRCGKFSCYNYKLYYVYQT